MAVICDEVMRGVRRVLLSRPERLNAIDDQLIADLHSALDVVEADPICRVLILTGAGRGFCAGFDLKGGDYDGDPATVALADLLASQKQLSGVALRLHELSRVVIAAVNGPAAGGGFALACAADIRVAASTASFVAANVKIGVSGGEMGLSWRLPRLIGEGRAAELLLTGRAMGAEEALAAGLVTSVVSPDQLYDLALERAKAAMSGSGFAINMTKELLDANASAASLRHAMQNEDRTQILCNFTGDVAEAIAAFRCGRPPEFRS